MSQTLTDQVDQSINQRMSAKNKNRTLQREISGDKLKMNEISTEETERLKWNLQQMDKFDKLSPRVDGNAPKRDLRRR